MALCEATLDHSFHDHSPKKTLGMGIDVYLQPLTKEFLQL